MTNFNYYGMGFGGPCDIYYDNQSYWCSNYADGGGGEVDRGFFLFIFISCYEEQQQIFFFDIILTMIIF